MSEKVPRETRFEVDSKGHAKDVLVPFFQTAALEIARIVEASNARIVEAGNVTSEEAVPPEEAALAVLKKELRRTGKDATSLNAFDLTHFEVQEKLPKLKGVNWFRLFNDALSSIAKEEKRLEGERFEASYREEKRLKNERLASFGEKGKQMSSRDQIEALKSRWGRKK